MHGAVSDARPRDRRRPVSMRAGGGGGRAPGRLDHPQHRPTPETLRRRVPRAPGRDASTPTRSRSPTVWGRERCRSSTRRCSAPPARVLGLRLRRRRGGAGRRRLRRPQRGGGARGVRAGRHAPTSPGSIALPAVPGAARALELPGRASGRPAQHAHGRLGFPAAAPPRAAGRLCSDACPAGNDVRGFVQAAAAGDDDAALWRSCSRPRRSPAPAAASARRRAWTLQPARARRRGERARARARARRPRRLARPQRGPAAPAWRWSAPDRPGSPPPITSRALGHPVTVLEAARRARRPAAHRHPGLPAAARRARPRDRLHPRPRRRGHAPDTAVDRAGLRRAGARVRRRARGDRAAEPARTSTSPAPTARRRRAGPRLPRRGRAPAAGPARGDASWSSAAATPRSTRRAPPLRLGARDVRVVYRRTRAEMPAIAEEIDEALEEGVVLEELLTPAGLCEAAMGAPRSCAGA